MSGSFGFALRPLSIGEIFDRAVTIYVRNFVVFSLMILTFVAPIGIMQYFVMPAQSQSITQAIDQASHPGKTPQAPLSGKQLAGLLIIVALALVLAPFANNAVALGVAQLYNGDVPSYAASYRAVFRRWVPLLGTALLNVLILIGLYAFALVLLGILATLGMLLVSQALPIAVAIFVLAAVAALAIIVLFLMFLIVYAFSMYASSIEEASPWTSTARAFARVFGRNEFKKALLMALAYIGLETGVLMVTVIVSLLIQSIVPFSAIQIAVNAILSGMLGAFMTILLAVYYYDVRTRAEGLDLETELKRLAAPA